MVYFSGFVWYNECEKLHFESENIMKKIFEKHETLFCMLLIIAYIIVNSFCIQNYWNNRL